MASGDGSPMTTPPPGPAYTPDNIQRMQQVSLLLGENLELCDINKTYNFRNISYFS